MDAALLDEDPVRKEKAALAEIQNKWLVFDEVASSKADEADSQGP